MSLRQWMNVDPHAELDFEIDGFKCTAQFSGHYHNQGEDGRHWECYQIQFHDVKKSVDEDIPKHIRAAAWKRAHITAVSLQRDMPSEKYYVESLQ